MGACCKTRDMDAYNLNTEDAIALQSGRRSDVTNDSEFTFSKSDLILKIGDFQARYKVLEKLGSGAFGECFLVEDKISKEKRAAKHIKLKKLSEKEEKSILKEINILKVVDHPNIAKLFEIAMDNTGKGYFLISEFCEGGELFDKIISMPQGFSEKQAADVMKQLLSAITYIHTKNICHKDLKPENILISTSGSLQIKVIDFGSAMMFNPGEMMTEVIGTPYYIAPELLKERQCNEKCDIWACGVILYVLLSGKPPFYGKDSQQILGSVIRGKFHFKDRIWEFISDMAKNLISKMLTYNYHDRPSAGELLQHPWFSIQLKDQPISENVVTNLKSFKIQCKLERAVLTYIVNEFSSRDELKELEQAFIQIDKNGDGILSREEILEQYKICTPDAQLAEMQVEELLKKVDVNGNGEIDFSEFMMAALDKKKILSQEKLKLAFDAFDIEKKGYITADNLKEVLGSTKDYSPKVWENLIAEIDSNRDGVIQWEEFEEALGKVL